MALKFFKRGAEYEGALQRERYVLERLSAPHHNLVSCVAHINYRGAHCLVMELLHLNIRQVSKRVPHRCTYTLLSQYVKKTPGTA